jgi:hypothetical protein
MGAIDTGPRRNRDGARDQRLSVAHWFRGQPPIDINAIEDILLRISRLVEEIPDISELDLNPIFALPPGQGCKIVDARIRVRVS